MTERSMLAETLSRILAQGETLMAQNRQILALLQVAQLAEGPSPDEDADMEARTLEENTARLVTDVITTVEKFWNQFHIPLQRRYISAAIGRRAKAHGGVRKFIQTLVDAKRIDEVMTKVGTCLYFPAGIVATLPLELLETLQMGQVTDTTAKRLREFAARVAKTELDAAQVGSGPTEAELAAANAEAAALFGTSLETEGG